MFTHKIYIEVLKSGDFNFGESYKIDKIVHSYISAKKPYSTSTCIIENCIF